MQRGSAIIELRRVQRGGASRLVGSHRTPRRDGRRHDACSEAVRTGGSGFGGDGGGGRVRREAVRTMRQKCSPAAAPMRWRRADSLVSVRGRGGGGWPPGGLGVGPGGQEGFCPAADAAVGG